MELTFRTLFIYTCIFSCIVPILIGTIHFNFLNKSLKVFLYWLIFNLLYAVTSVFLVSTYTNYFLEFLNTIVSFLFLYLILKSHWKNIIINKWILLTLIVVVIVSLTELTLFYNKLQLRKNYSATFQTILWVIISFYYLKRLISNEIIDKLSAYPMFWIGISNFFSSIISLLYFLLTNSALRFSRQFYYILENIAYSSLLGMYFLFSVGLYITKKNGKDIIKV